MSPELAQKPSGGETGTVPCLGVFKASPEATAWLQKAMAAVSKVFPQVDFGKTVDPVLADEFDAAIEARFYLGTMADEEFKIIWRKWYGAH